MSKRVKTLRRVLPLSIAAVLLVAAAPQLPAAEIAVGVGHAGHHGYQKAGLRVGIGLGIGYYGHHYWGHYRHYYPHRYYYRPYPYVYYRHPGDYGYSYSGSRYFGALDLNVKPKKTTQVYVDGNYVGTAANFDGWPEYLWLEKDSYEVIFYNPGYETIVRHVEVRPGVVIKIREDMRPGESVPVEELTTAGQPAARAPTTSRRTPPEPPVERRERVGPPPEPGPPGALDVRPEPARVQIQVAPADASVYLDGRFLGIAGEIGEQRSGILIDPGDHVLEIVRPGFESRKVDFEAEPGDDVKLEIELHAGPSKTGFSA